MVEKKLNVFDIEYFGTKDGPGIRTVIFFKGCPLNCLWCQNPESQGHATQVLYYRNSCVQCGQCISRCPPGAIYIDKTYGLVVDETKCSACGVCVDACIYNARKKLGNHYSIDEMKKAILKDARFFKASGGGVTFSGGEPAIQLEALKELILWLKEEGIHIAIETAGNFSFERMNEIADLFDLIFIDLKHVDEVKHMNQTGVSNEAILKNIAFLLKEKAETTVIRIPVVPGFNYSREDAGMILDFLVACECRSLIEILPYHNLGELKYAAMGTTYRLTGVESLKKSELSYWMDAGKERNLNVMVGTT